MDVLALDLSRSTSVPDASREAATGRESRRRRLADLLARLMRALPPGDHPGDVVGRRRASLLAYTGATIAVGIGLLAVTSLASAPWATIDPGIAPNTVLSGPTGGLLLWLLYGLIGSLRVLRAPGGSTLTFHLPFVGAAMILGGPTAGAWVAFLATIERRELETQPWYGILANHAILVTAAVLGGITVQVISLVMPGSGGGGLLVAAAAGALVLATVSTALGAITVMLREGLTFRDMAEILLGQVGRMTAIECALVVVLALAYLQVGWWAPLLVAGFVLVIWDNHPMPPPDHLTGLLGKEAFGRRLEAGIGRMRRGVTPSATVLHIDLDHFKRINDIHLYDVGDEVLAEVGVRLRAHGRRADDLVGRLGGDEFALFLPGLADPDVATERADAIVADLCRPIASTAGTMFIGASIGVVVVHAWGGVPSGDALLAQAAAAMHVAKQGGGGSHRYDPDEPIVALEGRRP